MNPDIANAKPGVLAALRRANNVIGIGDVHGWPRPQAYVDALAMLNAARRSGLHKRPLLAEMRFDRYEPSYHADEDGCHQ